MKKLLVLIPLAMSIYLQSCKNPCDGVLQYDPIKNELNSYVFNVGSFWAYRDSLSGATDSQYVYEYIKNIHKRDPVDTPKPYYSRTSISGGRADFYCGPYYLDELYMTMRRFNNGVLVDTGQIKANAFDNGVLVYIEHVNTSKVVYSHILYADASVGRYGYHLYGTPQDFKYLGAIPTITIGGNNFSNIDVYRLQQHDVNSSLFSDSTDLYIAKNAGIVKRVNHTASGDVVWNLTNYRILQ